MKEKQIENQIKKYLKSIGAYTIKNHGNNFTRVGIPDLTVCYKGVFIGIEVKQVGKKPSEPQVVEINNIIKAGGIAFYTDNLDQVKQAVEKIDGEFNRS